MPDRKLLDFGDPDSRAGWVAVNDGVMGGLSRGGPGFGPTTLVFSGRLSLARGGGFASIRRDAGLDLSGYSGVRLRVRGDARTYQLRLQTDCRYRGQPVSFSGDLRARAGEWADVEVPFASLRARFRGRSLSGYRFDPARIESMGLLIADKQAGPFSLEVARITAYRQGRQAG